MTTRSFLLFSVLFSFSSLLSAQKTYYVSSNGSGDGSSWEKATNELTKTLNKAKAGDQIWISAGTYLPTTKNKRYAAFNIPNGVAVYGGFSGSETDPSQRNLESNPTVFSGNIGTDDNFDNCFNVVVIEHCNDNTILDGFTIRDGFASGGGVTGSRFRSGGGIFNDGENGSSNPTIRNCTFTNNFAKDGGAIYNNGRTGIASPTFENCVFEANRTDLDGGAVYNDGRIKGESNPSFTQCTFTENKGNYGGAISNYGMDGESEPTYTECVFTENMAYVKGGGIFHLSNNKIDAENFATVQFSNNSSLDHDSDEVYHYLVFSKQVAQR